MPTPPRSAAPPSDLRRAISRQIWLAHRARNALQRPAFIGAISVGTFVTAIVSMVVVPRTSKPVALPVLARPDTLSVAAAGAMSRLRLAQAESAVVAARADAAAAATRSTGRPTAAPIDSTMAVAVSSGPAPVDSASRAANLQRLLARADQAPLPSSYRALAESPELRADRRIRALMDSLGDVERDRESFGSVGGVDPFFVALTSRVNEIGRSVKRIASERLSALRPMPVDSAMAPVEVAVVDTIGPLARRDSARLAVSQADDSLAKLRAKAIAIDLEEDRARERANAVAPPLALLASAFVLSAVIGFAAALVGELRRPRVTDANELERFLGVRVLSTVETPMPSVERGRRQADRSAPPYFDPGAEGYQLAYLGLATDHPTILTATITGDEPAITAVIACNLAAVAADEARNTLVIDLDPSCSASAALRTRVQPGIVDIVGAAAGWPEATIAAAVGRDKTVDLVPFGLGALPSADALRGLLQRDAGRLTRYYDAIFVVGTPQDVAAGLPGVLPAPDVIYTARPGITPLRHLRRRLEAISAAGGNVRGVMLWSAERPLLATPRELTSRRRRKTRSGETVLAAT